MSLGILGPSFYWTKPGFWKASRTSDEDLEDVAECRLIKWVGPRSAFKFDSVVGSALENKAGMEFTANAGEAFKGRRINRSLDMKRYRLR